MSFLDVFLMHCLLSDSPPDTLEGKAQHVIDLQNFNAVAWTGVWCANMALDADLLDWCSKDTRLKLTLLSEALVVVSCLLGKV